MDDIFILFTDHQEQCYSMKSNQPTRQVNKQKGNIIAFEVPPFYILHN